MKKQVLVSVDRGETRVALLEATGTVAARKSAPKPGTRRRRKPAKPAAGYHVAELYLERRGARSIVGNIYKGRVDNVLAGLEAAFVDIGLGEERLPARRRDRAAGGRGAPPGPWLRQGHPPDHRHAEAGPGDRGPGGQGSAEDQGRPALDGPDDRRPLHGATRRTARASASRAGSTTSERDRLRKEAAKLDLKGAGAIIRTAAQGATRADLERELLYLFKLNEVLQKRVAETPAPALVFQEADLSVRVVRDIFSVDVRARDRRRPQAASPARVVLLPHRARARRARRAVGGGHAAVRGLRGRGGARLDALAAGRSARAAAT